MGRSAHEIVGKRAGRDNILLPQIVSALCEKLSKMTKIHEQSEVELKIHKPTFSVERIMHTTLVLLDNSMGK